MNDQTFRALLDLLMCSDPWPTPNDNDQRLLVIFADDEARERGFDNWVNAYHRFKS